MRIPLPRGRYLLLELRRSCRHDVPGICPVCYPDESRTRTNKKLALALAWLERLSVQDPYVKTLDQLRTMASDGINQVADL